MASRIGDSLFTRDGYPGFVKGKNPQKGTLEVERQGPAYDKGRAYGFINGMANDQRQEFQSIIDTMREKEELKDRVDFLHEQIEEVKQDPKRNVLTRYLEGELSHMMNSEGVMPRVYNIDEHKT